MARIFPVGDPDNGATYAIANDSDWRVSQGTTGSEGIIDDTTGDSLRLSAGADGNSVVVAPGRVNFCGQTWDETVPTTLAIAGGVSAGNTRADTVVLRWDSAASAPADRLKLAVRAGAAAPDATAAPPAPSRSGTVREFLVGFSRRVGTQSITDSKLVDGRSWAIRTSYSETAQLGADEPIGTMQLVGGVWWQRRLVAGAPTWVGGNPAALAHIHLTSGTSLALPSAGGIVPLPLSTSDSGAWADGGITCDGSSLLLPTPGVYLVNASVRFTPPAGLDPALSTQFAVQLYADGELVKVWYGGKAGTPGHAVTVSGSHLHRWAAGTRLTWRVLSSRAGASVDTSLVNSDLSVHFVRP